MSIVSTKDYWLCVWDEVSREDIFNVRDDGTIEYGPNYTPEKAREAFRRHFGIPKGSAMWGGGETDISDHRGEAPPHFISGIEFDMNIPTEK